MKDIETSSKHKIRCSTFEYDIYGERFTWYWAVLAKIEGDGSVIGKEVSEPFLEKMRDYIAHPQAGSIVKGYEQGIYLPWVGGDRLFYKKGIYLLWADECCFLVCSSAMAFKAALVLMGL